MAFVVGLSRLSHAFSLGSASACKLLVGWPARCGGLLKLKSQGVEEWVGRFRCEFQKSSGACFEKDTARPLQVPVFLPSRCPLKPRVPRARTRAHAHTRTPAHAHARTGAHARARATHATYTHAPDTRTPATVLSSKPSLRAHGELKPQALAEGSKRGW